MKDELVSIGLAPQHGAIKHQVGSSATRRPLIRSIDHLLSVKDGEKALDNNSTRCCAVDGTIPS